MPDARRRTTLGALGRIVVGRTPRADDPANFGGPVPFITPVDMDGRRTIAATARTLTEVGARSLAAARVPRGSVLVACIGADVGKVALADVDAVTNQQIGSVVVAPPHCSLYLYYHLRARQAELRAAAGGSAQPILTKSALVRLPVDLPAPARQRAVAGVLGALDDKIELNRRLCATLAELAATRFRALFVEFDRAGECIDSELGPIPAGFTVARLGQLIALDKGLSYRGALLGEVGPPMLGLGDFTGHACDPPRRYSGRHLGQHRVAPGDLLIAGSDLSQRCELLGAPMLVPDLGAGALLFSQHVYAARVRAEGDGWPEFLYFALRQPEFRARAAAFATGTTVLALPRDAVLGYALAVPPAHLRAEFSAFARPLLARIEHARRQSRELAQLRDHVLPDLMSGALAPPPVGGPGAVA